VPPFAAETTITVWGWTLTGVLIVISLILMFIVLIQRGKGGGLAGAFGGPGGSSAFGSRAGDAFTKITLYLAAIWVLVIMISVKTFAAIPEAKKDTPGETAPGDQTTPPTQP
jgi:preprotein translocase subunit SecG